MHRLQFASKYIHSLSKPQVKYKQTQLWQHDGRRDEFGSWPAAVYFSIHVYSHHHLRREETSFMPPDYSLYTDRKRLTARIDYFCYRGSKLWCCLLLAISQRERLPLWEQRAIGKRVLNNSSKVNFGAQCFFPTAAMKQVEKEKKTHRQESDWFSTHLGVILTTVMF